MTEIQAVIGRIQLERMLDWHEQRLSNARKIWSCAEHLLGLRVPVVPDNIEHAAYKSYFFVEQEELNSDWDRNRILIALRDRGVPCYLGSCPEIYLEKAFDNTESRPANRLPVARKIGETSLMFLVHPALMSEEIEKTCQVLTEIMLLATAGVRAKQHTCNLAPS